MRKSLLESRFLLSIHGSSQQNRDKWIETDKHFFFCRCTSIRFEARILIAGFHGDAGRICIDVCIATRRLADGNVTHVYVDCASSRR